MLMSFFANLPKWVYGVVGAKHPIGSTIVVAILCGVIGAVVGSVIWAYIGDTYNKEAVAAATQKAMPLVPSPPLVNQTAEDCGIIASGAGNKISGVTCTSEPERK